MMPLIWGILFLLYGHPIFSLLCFVWLFLP